MILEIKHYPDPILKKKCKKVENVNEQEKLIKAHKIYIYRAENSIPKMPITTEKQRVKIEKKKAESWDDGGCSTGLNQD